MKSKEELEVLKNEYENLSKKISELTEEEVKEVTGGWFMKGLLKSDEAMKWINDNSPITHFPNQ